MSDQRRLVGPYQPEELELEQPATSGPREVLPCSACNGFGVVSDMAYDGRETTWTCPDCQGHGALDVESQQPVDLTAFVPRMNAATRLAEVERIALNALEAQNGAARSLARRVLEALGSAPEPDPWTDPAAPVTVPDVDPWTSPVSVLATDPEGTTP